VHDPRLEKIVRECAENVRCHLFADSRERPEDTSDAIILRALEAARAEDAQTIERLQQTHWHREAQANAEDARVYAARAEKAEALEAATLKDLDSAKIRAEKAEARLAALRAIVDDQAESLALWFLQPTASEALLQSELRRLHAAIEEE